FDGITYDPEIFSSYRYVAGAVISWGTLTSHGNGLGLEGFRAKWSRPILLLQPKYKNLQPLVARIAARVGAAVVTEPQQLQAQTQDWNHLEEAVEWKPEPLAFDRFETP